MIAFCTLLNALDGYDVLAMSFTAKPVSAEFALDGTALMFGGTVGALLYGVATVAWPARAVFGGSLALSAVGLAAFILLVEVPEVAFGLGVLVGLLMNAAIAGIYTLAPQAYPAAIRSTGVGVALGVGRVGGIVAPIVVGMLLDAGVAPVALYLGIAAVLVALSPIAWLVRRPDAVEQVGTRERNQAAEVTDAA